MKYLLSSGGSILFCGGLCVLFFPTLTFLNGYILVLSGVLLLVLDFIYFKYVTNDIFEDYEPWRRKTLLCFYFVFCFICLLAFKQNFDFANERKNLLENGIASKGVVVDKSIGFSRKGMPAARQVIVKFKNDDQQIQKEFLITLRAFDGLKINQVVDLHYLPGNPIKAILDDFENTNNLEFGVFWVIVFPFIMFWYKFKNIVNNYAAHH